MVISVDTGNKMIKTEHYEFNSGIDVLDTIPGENDEVIEIWWKILQDNKPKDILHGRQDRR